MKIKRFKTVEEMVLDTFGEKEGKKVIKEINKHREETQIAISLAELRIFNGLTNKEMAKKMKVPTKTVNSIENSFDDDLTIDKIKKYIDALGYELQVSFIKKEN